MENMASRESTPSFSAQSFRVIGIQALELFRENGIGAKVKAFFRNGTGEIFPARVTNSPDARTISAIPNAFAASTIPRDSSASVPVVSMSCTMEQNTTRGINFTTTFMTSMKKKLKNSISSFTTLARSPARLTMIPKKQAKNSI